MMLTKFMLKLIKKLKIKNKSTNLLGKNIKPSLNLFLLSVLKNISTH